MAIRHVSTTPLWAATRRVFPLAVLAAGFAAFFLLGLNDYFTLDVLRDYRVELLDWVARNEGWAVAAYVAAYAAVVAFSVPGAAVMTIAGGFLFGTLAATVYAVLAATAGASILFLAARRALADLVAAKTGGAVRRMEAGFRRNALSYLIFLRLIPLFPFWLVNLVPAVLGVQLRVFVLGTFIGIIPGTLVFAGVGDGLAVISEQGGTAEEAVFGQPRVLLPILGLAVLALLPAVASWFRGRRARRTSASLERDED